MRILGVDPGSLHAGWGLIGGMPRHPTLLASGIIHLPATGAFPTRLHRLHRDFEDLVGRLAPTAAAVESPFHGANARSALQLAHARGVLLLVLAAAGLPIAEYAPAVVKKSVTGNGRAEKVQVQQMVARLLGLRNQTPPRDAADALAVALCHVAVMSAPQAIVQGHARR